MEEQQIFEYVGRRMKKINGTLLLTFAIEGERSHTIFDPTVYSCKTARPIRSAEEDMQDNDSGASLFAFSFRPSVLRR